MGLFSKLFSKQEKKSEEPKEEGIYIDDEYCRFGYFANPNSNEYGYEGNILPEDSYSDLDKLTVYLDTDGPETTEAGKCYTRFKELFADMDRVDFEVKKTVADFFLLKPEYTDGKSTQQLIDGMQISWMGFFRNGDTQFSIDNADVYASDIDLFIKADGSKEIQYEDYDHGIHKDKC